MPRSVAVSVRNWAMARQTFAAMSCWLLRNKLVKASATATRNDNVAIVFSSLRFIEDNERIRALEASSDDSCEANGLHTVQASVGDGDGYDSHR